MTRFSNDAYKYVNGIPAVHWSRHAFSTTCKSSLILNNLCETFNAVLKDDRDKPIITCMECFEAIDNKFEVDYKRGWWVVNLKEKTCSFRHWELVGIPCTHAMACILDQRHNPDDFVDDFYYREKYFLAYIPVVNPMRRVSQ